MKVFINTHVLLWALRRMCARVCVCVIAYHPLLRHSYFISLYLSHVHVTIGICEHRITPRLLLNLKIFHLLNEPMERVGLW